MKIIECKQGSPEWWEARCGIPSASNFHRIITPKTWRPSAQADDYINELIADRLMGGVPEEAEAFTTRAMQHGIETEAEARAWYAMEAAGKVRQVGLCIADDGHSACSPDALVGDDGGLELKCPLLKTHVGYLRAGILPAEYTAQVHGSLIVTGRKWWDFCSYSMGLPPFCIRVVPDNFTEALRDALEDFHPRYMEEWEKVKAWIPADPPAMSDEDAALDCFSMAGRSRQ